MELMDYLRVLRRRWLLVVGAPVIALAVAIAVTVPAITSAQRSLTSFEATHLLLAPNPDTVGMPLGTLALVASSSQFRRQVTDELGGGDEVADRVGDTSVTADGELRVVSVTTTGTAPAVIERVADTYAEQILAFLDAYVGPPVATAGAKPPAALAQRRERLDELDAQLGAATDETAAAELRKERDKVLRQIGRLIERADLQAQGVGARLMTLQTAGAAPVDAEGFQPPTTPGPRLLLATLMGLLLGVALAFVVDRSDTTIRSRADAETAYAVPVIAEVPRLSRRSTRRRSLVTTAQPGSMAAEAYRQLRLGLQVMPRWLLRRSVEPGSLGELVSSRIDLDVDTGRGRVVLVTSPGPGEGKTTTVANLAASFAEIGKSVLLLDCDFRAPQLAQVMQAEPDVGVADFLRTGGDAQALVELAKPSFVPNVWVVPAGEAVGNPGELLRPDTNLLSLAATLTDVVIVDVGPLLAVNEGATLAPLVDALVLVARAGQTTVDAARRAAELAARIEAPVSGSVLVGVRASEMGGRYYYGGYGNRSVTNGHASKTFPRQPQVVRG